MFRLSTVIALVTALVAGMSFLWHFWPERPRPIGLVAVLALPAGLALTSLVHFACMLAYPQVGAAYPWAEVALVAVASGWVIWHERSRDEGVRGTIWLPREVGTFVSLGSVIAAAVACFATSVALAAANPWGYYDAWARIQRKARMLHAAGDDWFVAIAERPHADYPLLLENAIARSWSFGGEITLEAPMLLSLVVGVWLVLVLYGVVAWLRGPRLAAVAALALLADPKVWLWASMQYADLLLATYFVIALALLLAARRSPAQARAWLLLAGFFAGSAAWCKNEGLAFALFVVVFGLLVHRSDGGWKSLLAGAAGPLLAVSWVKITFHGASPERRGSILDLFFDPERHMMVIAKLRDPVGVLDPIREFDLGTPMPGISLACLAALVVCVGLIARFERDARALAPIALVGALIIAYHAMLVVSPFDLQWQLDTALDRLLLQLWPILLLSVVCSFRDRREDDAASSQRSG